MMGDMMGLQTRHEAGDGARRNDALCPDDGRPAGLHQSRLEITDAQMAAWDAYAAAVRARHATMESMHADMMKAKESGSALAAHGCPHQSHGEHGREPQGAQARDGRPLRRP